MKLLLLLASLSLAAAASIGSQSQVVSTTPAPMMTPNETFFQFPPLPAPVQSRSQYIVRTIQVLEQVPVQAQQQVQNVMIEQPNLPLPSVQTPAVPPISVPMTHVREVYPVKGGAVRSPPMNPAPVQVSHPMNVGGPMMTLMPVEQNVGSGHMMFTPIMNPMPMMGHPQEDMIVSRGNDGRWHFVSWLNRPHTQNMPQN